MDQTGLKSNIIRAMGHINNGRKGYAIRGKEQKSRIAYEDGTSSLMTLLMNVKMTEDPSLILFAEYHILLEEIHLCPKSDKETINSLQNAIISIDEAFLALKEVSGKCYHAVEKTTPQNIKYRYKGLPKDAFHIACLSHITRMKNILRSPGLDPIEKDLLKQRQLNFSIAQNSYLERQRKAITTTQW